jgi:hypothetical protein
VGTFNLRQLQPIMLLLRNQLKFWNFKLFFNLRYGRKALLHQKNGWSYPNRAEHSAHLRLQIIEHFAQRSVYVCYWLSEWILLLTGYKFEHSEFNLFTNTNWNIQHKLHLRLDFQMQRTRIISAESKSALSYGLNVVWELATRRGECLNYVDVNNR